MLKLFHTEDPALPALFPQPIPIVKRLLDPPDPESTSVQDFVVSIEKNDELSVLNK